MRWFKPPNKPIRKVRTSVAITLLLIVMTTVAALAAEYFINVEGQTEEINGALFVGFFPGTPTGTGNFDPFLRISQSNQAVVKGFNTYAAPQFQEDDTWTSAQNISEIPVIAFEYPPGSGIIKLYRELQLDINQNAGGDGKYLSLDIVEIFITEDPDLTGYDPTTKFSTNATLVYDMDELEDNWIKFDYTNNNGSGKRDMKMLIPNEWLTEDPRCAYTGPVPEGSPNDCPYYFVMYNEFGSNYDNNDGFEEWGSEIYPVASKTGVKYNDLNKNGVRDEGEPGLEGWTIYLDLNDDGDRDAGEPFAVTGVDGFYEIQYIIPNPTPEDTWIVREEQQDGWYCSEPADSDDFGCYYDENFAPDAVNDGNDFGNYEPALTATKTAAGTWDRMVTWTLEKSVSPASHEGYAGDSFSSDWEVVLTKNVEGPANFQVSGTITVNNPNTFDVPFSVSDVLNDFTSATVSCPASTIPAGGTVECTYLASPDDASATENLAIVTSDNPDVAGTTATVEVIWSENLTGSDTGDLTDPRFAYDENVSSTTTETFNETFTCSSDPADYTGGSYTDTFTNDAYFVNSDHNLHADAEVGITCHLDALVPTKTAAGEWDRTVTWTLEKSVSPASHEGDAGDSFDSVWEVVLTKNVVGPTNYYISGEISIYNPATIAQSFTVADELNDGTLVSINCPSNTVAAGGTETCTYEAFPDDDLATLNTATVSAAGNADQVDTATVGWSENLTGYDDGTLSDPHLDYEELISDTTSVIEDETFACSADSSLYAGDGHYQYTVPNTATLNDNIDLEASASVTVDCYASFVNILKTTNGSIDPTKDIRFDLISGTDVHETLSTYLDEDGVLEFQTALVPGDTYTICESPVPAGYTFEITVDGGNVLTYAGPPGTENPTGEIQCFNFVAAASPTTLLFEVNNSYPGGAPRTPGYWKNWNTCTGGRQAETAAKLGGVAEGVFLLDDLLPQTVGSFEITTCEVGVLVLDSRSVDKEKNMSNDAAYALARNLLAARLNQDAGACDPDGLLFDGLTFEQVLTSADALLDGVGFDGTGGYLGPKNKKDADLRTDALYLAGIIDDYNNSLLCTGEPSH